MPGEIPNNREEDIPDITPVDQHTETEPEISNKARIRRSPEKTKERTEKRAKLRQVLPSDLQLQYFSARPDKQPWQMEGQLLARRHSEIQEDANFYKAIKSFDKEGEKVFDAIKSETEIKRESMAKGLKVIASANRLMKECLYEGQQPYIAGKIALAAGDTKSAKKAMEKCLADHNDSWAGDLALKLGDTETAKKILQEGLKIKKSHYLAMYGEIALGLGDTEAAKKVMESSVYDADSGGQILRSAGQLALAIAERYPESAKGAGKQLRIRGFYSEAADIAIKLGDTETVKQIMEEMQRSPGRFNLYEAIGEVALKLGDTDTAKEMIEKLIDLRPNGACDIAIKLGDSEIIGYVIEACLGKDRFDLAADLATKITEQNPEMAKITMQICQQAGRYTSVAKLSFKFGDMETTTWALDKCSEKQHYADGGNVAVEILKEMPHELLRLSQDISKLNTGEFGNAVIAEILKSGEDVGKFQTEFLPRYLEFKKHAEDANLGMDFSKQWSKPGDFFERHDAEIGRLTLIDPKKSFQLMGTLTSRGLSYAEANMNLYTRALNEPDILYTIGKAMKEQEINSKELGDLLEIASCYESMGRTADFVEIVQPHKGNFSELKNELNQQLLRDIAKELGIEAEISNQDIKPWKVQYFQNLLVNGEMLKQQKDEDGLNLYNSLLKACFEGRFSDFISNPEQKDEMGKKIVEHNQRQERVFKKAGINWEQWNSFQGQVEMEVGTAKKQDREALFTQFAERLEAWKESVTTAHPELKGSLNKAVNQLKQKKRDFDFSQINLSDPTWLEQTMPAYAKTLEYIRRKQPDFVLSKETAESFQHLQETIKSIMSGQINEQTSKKSLTVKKWDRDPRRDLFQGNATHCCISVGVKEGTPEGGLATFHPETILEYLVDKGINIAEVVDPETGDVVAQAWLFVTKDEAGKPVLVADNFEVNNRYPAGNNVNRGLRDSMFRFLKEYATASNIPTVILGNVNTNDVETEELKEIKLPKIRKLGGYLQGPYYLEALGDTGGLEVPSV